MTSDEIGRSDGSDQLRSGDQRFDGLRILGFCDYFTEGSSGGAEKVTAEVYSRLIDLGAAVTVVTVVPGGAAGSTLVDGIPTVVVPGRDLSRLAKAQITIGRGIVKAARQTIEEMAPNVIHASSVHFQGSVVGSRMARRHRIPLVTTAHIGSIEMLPPTTRLATNAYEHSVARMIIRSSDRVIAVSDAVADHMKALGAHRDSIRVVPNGVDHDRFKPGDGNNEQVEFVFIGRLIENKGPDEVLRAFAALQEPAARLTFVGDGPMRAALEAQAQQHGVAGRVRFVGHVADVAPYLATADVMVRPSRTEGQSLAILEAMAAGVAVVASDIDANAELLEDGVSGLLVGVGDDGGLLDAMTTLTSDSALRSNLAGAARRRALAHSWDKCAVETGAILAEVARGLGV